jgi:protein O-GlcNAc transferase
MVLDRLGRCGVDAGRVEFAGRLTLVDFLAAHARVDFALDSWPWAGHTTTCHGLCMGVPTLSLAGPAAVSRAGKSVMGAIGLDTDWVADTPEQFATLAAARAADVPALAALRAGMRDRLLSSPVTDTAKFAVNFETALRTAWASWCRSNPPAWGI